ncbi:MAG: ABC transporter substrate-binding protein [Syntrophales bacterium]|nr:ABC transporter substrate-binding protein [Syntrophales bacterium]MDY0044296.1 ABC transporter substrate-binding protein [Syntrophales bacterium]
MRRNKVGKWMCLAVLIAGIIFLSGTAAEILAEEPIRIGLIGAFSSPQGISEKTSLEISIQEINDAGGIMGRPVELVAEDFKMQMPLAMAAYKKMVLNDKCLLIFVEGTEGTTACAQLGARLYQSNPHLLFSVYSAGFNMDIVGNEYDKYKFLFHPETSAANFYSPGIQLMEFFRNTVGTKKLALLIEDVGWTELFRNGKYGLPSMKDHFEKNGIEVAYYTLTDIKEKMFLPILEKVAASGADTIYWITGYTDTVALVKQWAQSAAKDVDIVLWAGACAYAAFWKMTGGRALGATPQGPEIVIPYTKRTVPFISKLKEKGVGVLSSTYSTYDGPWILKKAVEDAGGTSDVEKLIKIIEGGEFQHGFWIWAFDSLHESKKGYPYQPFPLGQFQTDGKFVLVHPEKLVEMTNPGLEYIRVKDLRKKTGQ